MKIAPFIVLVFISFKLTAGEGMWLPSLLSQLNEKEMRGMGMRLSAEELYDINHSSLKDAIVQFGGGCTAELVSDKGLILTNHHCGYGNIQRHSSLEHDYLTNGFWAQSYAEELPNPGLTVTFLVRMEDVTSRILEALRPGCSEKERDETVKGISKQIVAEAVKGTHYKAMVKPYYSGNQYFLLVTETYIDVRLVGAPPSNIGKFGGDTDNWMWPRHTGDFSVFRIYAGKDNLPAEYSKENVPYQPKRFLSISLKGVKEGDFTMVYGFPGTTQQYLPSEAVNAIAFGRNPVSISLRQKRLDLINEAMDANKLIRIQYSAKAAGIANGWKKMIGESRGIQRLDAVEKKRQYEEKFVEWCQSNPDGMKYKGVLENYNSTYASFVPLNQAYTYAADGLLGAEITRFAWSFNKLIDAASDPGKTESDVMLLAAQANESAKGYFKNYNALLDRKIFAAMMQACAESGKTAMLPPALEQTAAKYKRNYDRWAADLYSKSLFADSLKLFSILSTFSKNSGKRLSNDPAYRFASAVYTYLNTEMVPQISGFYAKTDSLQRVYMAAQIEMEPSKRFYPDANSTLRIAYGKVEGYYPADGVKYHWFTTLDGIIQKENPEIYDYVVEPRLKELYQAKDYGAYADSDGSVHVAFIASNHTTGGNSGSPVLDADGNLVGINFDRCWEGTMSDLMYDPDQCRNISLDIRYCLFVIDKFAGASHLIKEMNIVRN